MAYLDTPRGLLHIPRELRDQILALLLPVMEEAPIAPTDGHAHNGSGREELVEWEEPYFKGAGIMYPQPPRRPSPLPTLLVNHQLRLETLALVQHLKLPGLRSYKMDLMLLNEKELWPTWLYLPTLARELDEVYVNIRTCSVGKLSHRSGFIQGNGGPPWITWCFYYLLKRFLCVGPIGRRIPGVDQRIAIKNLIINVQPPDISANLLAPISRSDHPSRAMQHCDLEMLRNQTGIDYVMHPTFLVNFLSEYMFRLLSMDYYTASYGGFLYESIGTITFLLDGELHVKYNLSEKLADLNPTDTFGNHPREQRIEIFKQWKRKTYRSRLDFGLKILPSREAKEQAPELQAKDRKTFRFIRRMCGTMFG